jgi:prolipoprotein diacylglyceryltransferase
MHQHSNDFGPIAIYRNKYSIITTFGLLVGLGFFLASIHAWFYLGFRTFHYPPNQIFILILRMSVFIPLGAYLMSRALDMKGLFNREVSLSTFFRVPGFALWGGFLSGFLTIMFSAYQFSWNPLVILDAGVFGLPLAQMFGRIGCLNYGCCHGKPFNGKGSIRYYNPETKIIRTYRHLKGVALYPTQLYSALVNLSIYLIFLIIVVQTPIAVNGLLTVVYLVLYGLKRFIVEFFRGEFPRTNILSLSLWQWFSIIFAVGGIVLGYSLLDPFMVAPTHSSTILDGLMKVKLFFPMTIIATVIITFIYSLHWKQIGTW